MSEDLVPPNVERMIPYVPGKPLSELERELGITGAIKLASNENALGPSPKVVEALREAAGFVHVYPDGGAFALRDALAKFHGVTMDEVVLGNGSNELIDLLCRTFPGQGDHVVFGKPSFVCYWLGSVAANRDFTEVPLRDHLAWDLEAMRAAVTKKTKLLFLANPNNPTGAHVPKAELEAFLRDVPERVVVVLDEAYVEYATTEDYASAMTLRDTRERLVVLRTFSKAYGIAATRVGYAVGPRELIQYLHRMRAPFNVNHLAQVAALAALADQEHVKRCVSLNTEERARITHALGELGLEVAPSQANFVLVNTSPVDPDGKTVYDALLRKGVVVRPMPAPIGSWLRITVGTAPMNDRMLQALSELKKK